MSTLKPPPVDVESYVVGFVIQNRWHRYPSGQGGRLVKSSSLISLKIRRAEGSMHVKYVQAQTFSRWCGMKVRRGGCQLRCRLVI
ncbi:hypothetical protein TNCV_232981 [Trichonephila clavipes]|nr:hypothetical protein TNCV_232981 [Trichonephila clavipes]